MRKIQLKSVFIPDIIRNLPIKEIVYKLQSKKYCTIQDDGDIDPNEEYVLKGSRILEVNYRNAELREILEQIIESAPELIQKTIKIEDLVGSARRLNQ